ncbi:hypothetical protein IU429_15195 [Nocardia elegans]|uniref:Uncharacterized protein n=1 Tax=Nocardia elegans TaxID=300029 RepID=A0ABW6T802_9NOCA|nr:hypothetical protein [Nocardia elegans]MBF6449016.1 hypothetical protein [Nocardia elegans]
MPDTLTLADNFNTLPSGNPLTLPSGTKVYSQKLRSDNGLLADQVLVQTPGQQPHVGNTFYENIDPEKGLVPPLPSDWETNPVDPVYLNPLDNSTWTRSVSADRNGLPGNETWIHRDANGNPIARVDAQAANGRVYSTIGSDIYPGGGGRARYTHFGENGKPDQYKWADDLYGAPRDPNPPPDPGNVWVDSTAEGLILSVPPFSTITNATGRAVLGLGEAAIDAFRAGAVVEGAEHAAPGVAGATQPGSPMDGLAAPHLAPGQTPGITIPPGPQLPPSTGERVIHRPGDPLPLPRPTTPFGPGTGTRPGQPRPWDNDPRRPPDNRPHSAWNRPDSNDPTQDPVAVGPPPSTRSETGTTGTTPPPTRFGGPPRDPEPPHRPDGGSGGRKDGRDPRDESLDDGSFTTKGGITYGRYDDGSWYGIDQEGERRDLPEGVFPLKNGDWRRVGEGHNYPKEDWAKTGNRPSEYIPKPLRDALERATPPDDAVPSIGDTKPSGGDYPEFTHTRPDGMGSSGIGGAIGEALTRARLRARLKSQGLKIVAEKPQLPIPGVEGKYFYPDFLCVDKDGNIVLVESKYNGSRYEPGQYKGYTAYRKNGDYGVKFLTNDDELTQRLINKYKVKPGATVSRVETYRWNGFTPDGRPGLAVDDPTLFEAADNYFADDNKPVVRRPEEGAPDDLEFRKSLLWGYDAILQAAAQRAAENGQLAQAALYQSRHAILEALLTSNVFPADQLQQALAGEEELKNFGAKQLERLLPDRLEHPAGKVANISAAPSGSLAASIADSAMGSAPPQSMIGLLTAVPQWNASLAALTPPQEPTATVPSSRPFLGRHARRGDQSLQVNITLRAHASVVASGAENARVHTYSSHLP